MLFLHHHAKGFLRAFLGSYGQEMHRLTLYVPARGRRCDQHAGADGRLWTATDAGKWAAGHIAKRPSVAILSEGR